MRYVSTRGEAPELSFEEAMMTGLARDGGLYVPSSFPKLGDGVFRALVGKSYEEIAFTVMWPFIGNTFSQDEFRALINAAYAGFEHPARAPLRQLAPDHFLLELFHGPTLAFKDFAMQLIGQMFQASLSRSGRRITIVGATSGDTGSAAIEAFKGLDNVDVFILFPEGRVSEVQQRQMTTAGADNVHALALDGDFDDCQARLKDMFNDHAFRDAVGLAGVNSINWGRVLAQVVYYVSAAVSLGAPDRKISFTVPSGNFGDIFAGYVAKQIGLPIDQLVIATNQNDILHRTMETGVQTKEEVVPSMSPSMDIQVSSNFERALFEAYGRDSAAVKSQMQSLGGAGRFKISQGAYEWLKETFASGRASEAETMSTIREELARSGTLLCPHSAVGVKVANEHIGDSLMVTLATAHPAKFPDAVEGASGRRPALPSFMADLFSREESVTRVPNDVSVLKTLVQERRRA